MQFIPQTRIHVDAEHEVRLTPRRSEHRLHNGIDLGKPQLAGAGHVDEHGARALQATLQQGRRHRLARRLGGSVLPSGTAQANRCGPAAAEDCPDIGEVEVDAAGNRDEVDDLGDAAMDCLVDRAERVLDGHVSGHDVAHLIAGNGRDRIHQADQGSRGILRT